MQYLLHFLYKIRFGAFDKLDEIKNLIEKILNSFGGALGFRYMIWFLVKEFVFDPLEKEGREAIMSGEIYKKIYEMLDTLMQNYAFVILLI